MNSFTLTDKPRSQIPGEISGPHHVPHKDEVRESREMAEWLRVFAATRVKTRVRVSSTDIR